MLACVCVCAQIFELRRSLLDDVMLEEHFVPKESKICVWNGKFNSMGMLILL